MGSGGCSQFQKLLQTLLCGSVPWETTLLAQQLCRMLGAGGWDQQGARSVILTLKDPYLIFRLVGERLGT